MGLHGADRVCNSASEITFVLSPYCFPGTAAKRVSSIPRFPVTRPPLPFCARPAMSSHGSDDRRNRTCYEWLESGRATCYSLKVMAKTLKASSGKHVVKASPVTTKVVHSATTGRSVAVKGIGALKDNDLKIKKGVSPSEADRQTGSCPAVRKTQDRNYADATAFSLTIARRPPPKRGPKLKAMPPAPQKRFRGTSP